MHGQSPATVHDGIEASKRRIVEISNKIRRLQRNISGDTSQVDRGLLRGVEQQIEELGWDVDVDEDGPFICLAGKE